MKIRINIIVFVALVALLALVAFVALSVLRLALKRQAIGDCRLAIGTTKQQKNNKIFQRKGAEAQRTANGNNGTTN